MELFFLLLLVVLMATALGSGYPVAFALPGSAILTISAAAICGYLFAGDPSAYFAQGGPGQWLSAGVTNLRGVYWEVERDTLIAIPLFIFIGHHAAAFQDRGRPADYHGAAVRPGARRFGHIGRVCGCIARRNDGNRRSGRCRNGFDFAAGDAA